MSMTPVENSGPERTADAAEADRLAALPRPLSDAEREHLLVVEYRVQNERARRLEERLRQTAGPLLDEYLNAVQRRENAVRAMARVL